MEYLSSWISPGAAFFLLVNVLIGAIVVTSRGQQGGRAASTRRLCRSASSMVLDRLRSFSMFSFQFQTTHLEESYYTLELEADEQQQPEPPAVAGPPVTAPASVPPPPRAAAAAAAAAADEASSERAKEEGEAGEDESSISSDKADAPSLQGDAEQSPSSGDAAVVVAAAEATTAAVSESQAAAKVAGAAAAVQRARACREEALEGKARLNARAELFIRQFKEDLKLQRLNSIMNYTRALRRGAGAAPATAHQ